MTLIFPLMMVRFLGLRVAPSQPMEGDALWLNNRKSGKDYRCSPHVS